MVQPLHRPRGGDVSMHLFGVTITPLLPAMAMNGGLSIFEDAQDPGAGPPLHIHHDADEVFLVAAGRFRFFLDGAVVEAGEGDVAVVPRGMPHTFLNVGEGRGRLIVTMQPGGIEGFFAEVYAAGLSVPEDMARIAEIGARYHLEFLGPNPLGE